MHFSDCQTSNKIFLFHNETEADWQVFPVRSALRSDTGGGHLLVPAHCQTISVNISNIHIYIFLIRNSWYNIMQYRVVIYFGLYLSIPGCYLCYHSAHYTGLHCPDDTCVCVCVCVCVSTLCGGVETDIPNTKWLSVSGHQNEMSDASAGVFLVIIIFHHQECTELLAIRHLIQMVRFRLVIRVVI